MFTRHTLFVRSLRLFNVKPQALRDEYPSLYLISVCIGPFQSGETPLQHYNSTLALHHLQAFADAIIYRGNDDLVHSARPVSSSAHVRSTQRAGMMNRASGVARSHRAGEPWTRNSPANSAAIREYRVSIADMNASLSMDIASYLFPRSLPLTSAPDDPYPSRNETRTLPRPMGAKPVGERGGWAMAPRNFDAGSLMAAACPIPSAKFIDLRSTLSLPDVTSASSSSATWKELAGVLARTAPLCPKKAGGHRRDVCIAAHHVLRGLDQVRGMDTTKGAPWTSSGGRTRRGQQRPTRMVSDLVHDATASASAEAGEVMRKHHGCAEWRTSTDVSFSPGDR